MNTELIRVKQSAFARNWSAYAALLKIIAIGTRMSSLGSKDDGQPESHKSLSAPTQPVQPDPQADGGPLSRLRP